MAFTSLELDIAIVRDPLIVFSAAPVMEAIARMSAAFAHASSAEDPPQPSAMPDCPWTELHHRIRSGCAVVVEPNAWKHSGGDDGGVRGLFTEKDGMRLCAQQVSLAQTPLHECRLEQAIALQESALTSASATFHLLQQHRSRYALILNDDHQVTGLATPESLLYAINHDRAEVPGKSPEASRSTAQCSVQESEAQSRALLAALPDYLCRIGADGVFRGIVTQNRQLDLVPSGTNPVGIPIAELLPEDIARRHQHYIGQAIATGELQIYEQQVQIGDRLQDEEVRMMKCGDDEVLLIIRDITDRKQTEQQIQSLIAGTAATTGQDFFPALVTYIVRALNATYAIVSKRIGDELHTLAIWANGALQPNFAYKIAKTPCEQVLQNGTLYCAQCVQQEFPDDIDLVSMKAESYLGVALTDAQGQAIGNLCVLSQQKIQNPTWAQQLLSVFAARASAELERQQATTALQQLNQELEANVAARTLELREREQFLQTVLDTVPLSVFWKDANSVYLGGNQNFVQDAGLSSVTELIGKTDNALPWGIAYAKTFQAEDRHILESGMAKLEIIEPIVQADGKFLWLEKNRIPLRNIHGEIIGILGTYQDITRRQETEENLRRMSARLNLAIEIAAIGIWDWDIENNILVWDDRMYEIYGILPHQFTRVYDAWLNALHPEDRPAAQATLERAIQGDQGFTSEFRVVHPDGDIRYVKANGLVQRDENGTPQRMLGINYDITDIKRAEEQLRVTNEELSRATRLKDEFLANMSHELRTPLNAVLGMTEGLLDHVFGDVSESQRKAIQIIERSGSHLLALINDILDLAKIESGQIDLEIYPTAVIPLCHASLVFVQQQAMQKDIQIETRLPETVPDVLMDERRIRQVLINLLTNAVKFTPEGGRICLEVSYYYGEGTAGESSENILRIHIQDTGIGIASDHINDVFQPFVQIDSTLSKQYQGTGLGLALVKRIVELHQGQVRLSSQEGVGTCFTVEIPCPRAVPYSNDLRAHDDGIPNPPPLPTEHAASPLAASPRILLVEDSEANVKTLSSYLGAKGCHLIVGKTGEDAIALTQSESPDLVLMDIQLPGMDGIEAIKRIRQLPDCASLPIVALTALAMTGDREQCLAAGASEYISKPVKLKTLNTVIQTHLRDQIPH